MQASTIVVAFSLLILSQAATTPHQTFRPSAARTKVLQWGPCDLNLTTPASCASLPVPLDYSNSNSSATVNIELLRVSATNSPSKGSVLFNPGGPGVEGRSFVAEEQDKFLSLTGGDYDLIGFNPRGIDDTLSFLCSKDTAESSLLLNLPGNRFDSTLGQLWASSNILSNACSTNDPQIGSLLGTAFVARDMMQIVDALDNDGLLRYWGFSYGSVLGATAALMFPDRIDKVIIDGVVNTKEYYHGYALDDFSDADTIFSAFCFACIANPSNCALAHYRNGLELQERLYSFFDDLKYNPIPVLTPTVGFLVDYSTVTALVSEMLYSPVFMPGLANILDGLFTGNYSAIISYIDAAASEPPEVSGQSLFGIMCGDKFLRESSPADAALPVLNAEQSSRSIGSEGNAFITTCAQWKFEARERYSGSFEAKTKNPLLVISNTWDPVTPLKSARNVSTYFEGSVLLEQKGYGHSSLSQGSLCTAKAIRAFFVNGTYPESGTICDVAAELFSNEGDGWDKVLGELASEES